MKGWVFSLNTLRIEDFEEVLIESSINAVPMVAFWRGTTWDKVFLEPEGTDVFSVLNSHLPRYTTQAIPTLAAPDFPSCILQAATKFLRFKDFLQIVGSLQVGRVIAVNSYDPLMPLCYKATA